jgi:hypothetical protein
MDVFGIDCAFPASEFLKIFWLSFPPISNSTNGHSRQKLTPCNINYHFSQKLLKKLLSHRDKVSKAKSRKSEELKTNFSATALKFCAVKSLD